MRAEFAHILSRVPLLRAWMPRASRPSQSWHERPLEALEWDEFQRLVIEGFVRRGYHVAGEFRSLTAGSDLLLRHDRETFLVDCKAWHSRKIDVDAVKALQRAILARGVNGGILVTTGRVGRQAGRAAAAARIQMIDGVALKALVDPVRRSVAAAHVPPVDDETMADTVPARDAQRAIPTSPSCPLCSKPMRLRTARRGRHAGHGFWSCIEHPHCKGLRALSGYTSAG